MSYKVFSYLFISSPLPEIRVLARYEELNIGMERSNLGEQHSGATIPVQSF